MVYTLYTGAEDRVTPPVPCPRLQVQEYPSPHLSPAFVCRYKSTPHPTCPLPSSAGTRLPLTPLVPCPCLQVQEYPSPHLSPALVCRYKSTPHPTCPLPLFASTARAVPPLAVLMAGSGYTETQSVGQGPAHLWTHSGSLH